MDPFGAPAPPPPAAGWYPDPAGSGSHRYWDGARWTDAMSSAIPPASPDNARDDARAWALGAHLSALLGLFVAGLTFVGPLVIYLVRKDDPFVRRHAAEALNFNLSVMLYAIVIGVVGLLLLIVLVGILVWLLLIPLGALWILFVCIAAYRAGQGDAYRYPLAIRFVSA
ncbi:MAG TPA: DUF4870 domain-containing protein [Solirubrobacteraceae bacterium]|nr:DUF4870 domain-containing protein [Solirubrobacteraceae bacterium]